MSLKRLLDIPEAEVTPEELFLSRRELMRGAVALVGAAAVSRALGQEAGAAVDELMGLGVTDERVNTYEAITTYNNFYEFGYDKSDPSRNSGEFVTTPWSVTIDGLAENTGEFALDELVANFALERRVYRMRCVEAWSMVIPWNGFELRDLLALVVPKPEAKFVAFETVLRPEQMIGQRRNLLEWPYVEGLRLDEAMNPLTILATGLYDKPLVNANGAPIRLVVPWKYGFKGIKSIVKISLTAEQPPNTWNIMAPHEYGFYANVNPEVDHPRWSQATERRIGEFRRRDTLMFNGYGELVADLYAGMDLVRNF
ncbi:MAG TPA: protein-methionine-sulfoxide reductase catalytic subunit MsrP [Trueperaceae bacterium]|nr:protein-methionine-sulfoxide reductase catalytic subunit MsrP [Trueperaceae bacterium]